MEHPFRTFRKKAKLSIDAVVDSVALPGASKASLSRIETGQQQPDFETIRRLIAFASDHGAKLTAEDFVNFPLAPPDTASSEQAHA